MARIGSFTAEKDGYVGSIRSLSINIKTSFVANKDKASDGAPDFRIYGGSAELGAAWWARSNSGTPPRDYLRRPPRRSRLAGSHPRRPHPGRGDRYPHLESAKRLAWPADKT